MIKVNTSVSKFLSGPGQVLLNYASKKYCVEVCIILRVEPHHHPKLMQLTDVQLVQITLLTP